MVTLPIINVSLAANAMIDYAKDRANKLLLMAEKPENKVNPASIGKIEDALDALKEADAELLDFANMNGFTLS